MKYNFVCFVFILLLILTCSAYAYMESPWKQIIKYNIGEDFLYSNYYIITSYYKPLIYNFRTNSQYKLNDEILAGTICNNYLFYVNINKLLYQFDLKTNKIELITGIPEDYFAINIKANENLLFITYVYEILANPEKDYLEIEESDYIQLCGMLCVDINTKEIKWDINGFQDLPVISPDKPESTLAIGGKVYKINNYNGNMREKWRFDFCITNIYRKNGLLILSGGKMSAVCISNDKILWKKIGCISNENIISKNNPTFWHDYMYLASTQEEFFGNPYADEFNKIIKFDADNGNIRKIFSINGEVNYQPSIFHNRLYFATQGSTSRLYYINLENDKMNVIDYYFGEFVYQTIVIDNELYCISSSGIYKQINDN